MTTSAPTGHPSAVRPQRSRSRPGLGLAAAGALVIVAGVLPLLSGVDVQAGTAPPLLADWRPRVGIGTLPALAIAWLACSGRVADWMERLPLGRTLLITWGLGVAWMSSLALVDGLDGIAAPLDAGPEYLQTARATTDVRALLTDYVSRIPLDAPDHWPVHIAGHPPGAVLTFIGLARLGLGSGAAAGIVVILVAATTPVAVVVAARALGAGGPVRRALPFLVLGPFAVWQAVSADALFAAVSAWGLAALALATRAPARTRPVGPGSGTARSQPRWGALPPSALVGWSLLGGLLLGWAVMLSYGLPLLGFLAAAVLYVGRRWSPLPVAAVAALGLILAVAVLGFRYWEALPVLHDRYYAGIARLRPAWYWIWADLAVLVLSAGPMLAAALAHAAPRLPAAVRSREPLPVLAAAALVIVAAADLSLMSKAEVERIWLPFVPWLLLLTAALPARWRRRGLVVQVGLALLVQHILWSRW